MFLDTTDRNDGKFCYRCVPFESKLFSSFHLLHSSLVAMKLLCFNKNTFYLDFCVPFLCGGEKGFGYEQTSRLITVLHILLPNITLVYPYKFSILVKHTASLFPLSLLAAACFPFPHTHCTTHTLTHTHTNTCIREREYTRSFCSPIIISIYY